MAMPPILPIAVVKFADTCADSSATREAATASLVVRDNTLLCRRVSQAVAVASNRLAKVGCDRWINASTVAACASQVVSPGGDIEIVAIWAAFFACRLFRTVCS